MVRQTIRAYLLLSACFEFSLALHATTYVLYLMGHGLDYFQVNLMNVVFFVTMAVFEIPTGALADVLGRRTSFVVACALVAASEFVYAGSSSVRGFALAEFVGAIGATCRSGAFQAWAVDQLRHHGFRGSLAPVFARCEVMGRGATLVGALAGPLLYRHHPSLPWQAGGWVMIVAGIAAAVLMREDYFVRRRLGTHAIVARLRAITASSLRFGLQTEPIRFVFILSFAQALACQAPNMQWQPFFRSQVPSVVWLGPIFAAIVVACSVGASIMPRLLKTVRCERRLMMGAQLITGVGIAATVLCPTLGLALTVFLIHEAARGGFVPVKDAFLHAHIPSAERATVLSFGSLAHHFGGVLGLLGSGWVAQHAALPVAWVASGLVLVVWTLGVGRWRPPPTKL